MTRLAEKSRYFLRARNGPRPLGSCEGRPPEGTPRPGRPRAWPRAGRDPQSRQAIEAGLVDQVHLNLVPVLFSSGAKFFGDYVGVLTRLEDLEVIQGKRVTHLIYDLDKP